jgi:hypothetical protein
MHTFSTYICLHLLTFKIKFFKTVRKIYINNSILEPILATEICPEDKSTSILPLSTKDDLLKFEIWLNDQKYFDYLVSSLINYYLILYFM